MRISAAPFAAVALCASLVGSCAAPERRVYEAPAMGTRFRIVLYADGDAAALRAADVAAEEAFARLAQLEAMLTDYDPASDLCRLSATSGSGAVVRLPPDLYEVLEHSYEAAELTDGAFDVTVGPYVRLWRRASRQLALPPEERLDEAARSVGYERMRLDREERTAELLAAGMRLDLGGIGKGYALDEMLRVLSAHGFERALIEGGGDIVAGKAPPDSDAWIVALDPRASSDGSRIYIRLRKCAVATSGDAFRYTEIDGRRYSHVLDPRTGQALRNGAAASVVAPDGTLADALASACCVLRADEAIALVERLPGVEARIFTGGSDLHGLEACESSGFARMMAPAPSSRSPEPRP